MCEALRSDSGHCAIADHGVASSMASKVQGLKTGSKNVLPTTSYSMSMPPQGPLSLAVSCG